MSSLVRKPLDGHPARFTKAMIGRFFRLRKNLMATCMRDGCFLCCKCHL